MKPFPQSIGLGIGTGLSSALLCVLLLVLSIAGCGDAGGRNAAAQDAAEMAAPATRLRVQVEPVRRAALESADRVTGTVRAFHRATVTAEVQGRVVARDVEAGADVEAGGALVSLESSRLELELRRAGATLDAAQTVFEHAQREFGRGEQLMAQSTISTQRLDDLRHAVSRARDEISLAEVARDTAQRNLEDATITAPFTGTVDSLAVDIGDFVTPGTPVATLVDLSRVRIFGGVTAREAARLEPGMSAQVTFRDLGGENFEATLQSVGRVAGRADGTYEIELWLEPSDVEMRDGLVAQIQLADTTETLSLLAPRAAILRREGNPEVFVVANESGKTIVRARRLRTGRSEGEWIEILDGLEEGDRVVWDGHFALEDGSDVVIDGTPAAVPAIAASK
jgi:RND family efflux transporter MFP subunit